MPGKWLGIPVAEFPAWAVAYLERDLANTNELARAFRNKEDAKAVALMKQLERAAPSCGGDPAVVEQGGRYVTARRRR